MKEREGVKAEEAEDVVCFSQQADHKEGGDLGRCDWPTCILEL